MPKQCNAVDCTNRVFGGGYCARHQLLRTDKKPKRIKPISEKKAKELTIYRKERIAYLKEHPRCEARLDGCRGVADQIHHKGGRIGEALTDPKNFLAVCDNCHRWIELNPVAAKELHLSVSRLNKAS